MGGKNVNDQLLTRFSKLKPSSHVSFAQTFETASSTHLILMLYVKPLQGQQVAEKDISENGEKRSSAVSAGKSVHLLTSHWLAFKDDCFYLEFKSLHSFSISFLSVILFHLRVCVLPFSFFLDPPLKDGTNHDNIQRSMDRTMELESSEAKSPFGDLYQMIKKSLDVKTPRKSTTSLLQTPSSRFCTPRPVSVRKNGGNPITSTGDNSAASADESKVLPEAGEAKISTTPKSLKKQRDSGPVSSGEMEKPKVQDSVQSEAASNQAVNRATPQKPSVNDGTEKDEAPAQKSPLRRRSKEVTPAKPAVTSPKTELKRTSPRNFDRVKTGELQFVITLVSH